MVPYSQRYLFNAIPGTNHNANPTNPTNPTKPNVMTPYDTLNNLNYNYALLFCCCGCVEFGYLMSYNSTNYSSSSS